MTVISPNARIDVALPADLPVADLLPALLRAAGDNLADRGGWTLQRLGESPLDLDATPASLSLRDGEILHLRPAQEVLPELAFDDVADAIATGRNEGTRQWTTRDGRRAGLAAAVGATVLAAALVLRSGPPWHLPAVAFGGVAVLLVVAAGVLSRAIGDAAAALVVALAGVGFAALAGATALADGRSVTGFGATCLLGACAAALATATLGAVAVGDGFPLLTGVATAALVGVGASALDVLTDLDGGRSAAVVAAVVLAATQFVPSLSMRLADLPQPAIPLTADDVRRDDTVIAGSDVIRRTVLADRYITAFVAATAAVTAGCAVVLSTRSGSSEPWLLAVLAAVTGLRGRVFPGRTQRIALLLSTAVGVVALVVATAAGDGQSAVTFGLGVPLLVLAAVLVAVALVLPGRVVSPVTARIVDLVDGALVIAVMPLVLAVLGLYGRVRGWAG